MAESLQPLVKSITPEGFLSFAYAPDGGLRDMPLAPLNVIIGPNGSGKSNLIEGASVLRAVPQDLPPPIRRGGGVMDWLWKGGGGYESGFSDGSGAGIPAAQIEVVFGEGRIARFDGSNPAVRHRLVFGTEGNFFVLLDERLENAEPALRETRPYFYFGYLCLLAISTDPDPPPLVCIEEPELRLHPDIQPQLAMLLLEGSARTQLVVTTHSDVLVFLPSFWVAARVT